MNDRQTESASLSASPAPMQRLGCFCPPACGISRAEWHTKAWALYHAKTFDDTTLHKVSIHTIRAIFDATFDALFVTPNVQIEGLADTELGRGTEVQ